MPHALVNPNLPQSYVRTVLLGEPYAEELSSGLAFYGISCLTVPCVRTLAKPVCAHADMIAHHLGGNKILLCKNLADSGCKGLMLYIPNEKKHAKDCSKAGGLYCNQFDLLYSMNTLGKEYPDDISCNILRIGKIAFHALKHTEPVLLRYLNEQNVKLVSVKQGYSKCAVCIVDEKSAITSDKGLYCALRDNGIEGLLIEHSHVDLPGYEYGMIGGATGLLGKHLLGFTGHLRTHPDRERIHRFLESRSVKPVFLTDRKLFDIGSIIPVEEEDTTEFKV